MANMSYCRFENTAGDFQDCVDALADGKLHDASSYEKRAAEEMYEAAQEYVKLYVHYLNEVSERESAEAEDE